MRKLIFFVGILFLSCNLFAQEKNFSWIDIDVREDGTDFDEATELDRWEIHLQRNGGEWEVIEIAPELNNYKADFAPGIYAGFLVAVDTDGAKSEGTLPIAFYIKKARPGKSSLGVSD